MTTYTPFFLLCSLACATTSCWGAIDPSSMHPLHNGAPPSPASDAPLPAYMHPPRMEEGEEVLLPDMAHLTAIHELEGWIAQEHDAPHRREGVARPTLALPAYMRSSKVGENEEDPLPDVAHPTAIHALDGGALQHLHQAITMGKIGKLKRLLARPAYDVNAQDEVGNTPLHLAVMRGDLEGNIAFSLLLECEGLHPNPFNDVCYTPLDLMPRTFPFYTDFIGQGAEHGLHICLARHDLPKLFTLLADTTYDHQYTDSQGNNALQVAIHCRVGDLALQSLLNAGVHLNHANAQGQTPLDLLPPHHACYPLLEAEGALSLDNATIYHVLGDNYREEERYDMAITAYKEALYIRKAVLGNHEATATALHSLGLAYGKHGRYRKAIKRYKEALRIRKAVLGKHEATATALHSLGLAYGKHGRYRKAIKCYKEALYIRKAVLGNHEATATTHHNLGVIYDSQWLYKEAAPHYQEALRIYQEVLGVDHVKTQTARRLLANVRSDQSIKRVPPPQQGIGTAIAWFSNQR